MRSKRVLLFALLSILVLAVGLYLSRKSSASSISWEEYFPPQPVDNNSFSFLSANVGNADPFCTSYKWKLCYQDVENRIARNVQRLAPDVVFIQEALAPWQCQKGDNNPAKVCHYSQTVHQARRILGDNYTIVCAARYQYDCIAVKIGSGEITGCEPGQFCTTEPGRETVTSEGCDDGFDVIAATIQLKNGAVFDGVNVHLQSTSAGCRARMLEDVFENAGLLKQDNLLVAGDFNFDPFRSKDKSALTFQRIFDNGWKGRPFNFHSGIAEKDPPPYTYTVLFKRTLDLAFSNFLEGITHVLGITPGTPSLDEGKGMDHRALFGVLSIK